MSLLPVYPNSFNGGPPLTQIWNDPGAVVMQQVYDAVQVIAGNTPDGRPRNTAPAYVFGETEYESGVPGSSIASGTGGTVLPAVVWCQGDMAFTRNRHFGNGFNPGTQSSMIIHYRGKIFGTTRAQAMLELMYLVQGLGTQYPGMFTFDPPLHDLKAKTVAGKAQGNQHYTLDVNFSVPIKTPWPTVATQVALVEEVIVSGSIVQSSSFPPIFTPPADRVFVVTGSQ